MILIKLITKLAAYKNNDMDGEETMSSVHFRHLGGGTQGLRWTRRSLDRGDFWNGFQARPRPSRLLCPRIMMGVKVRELLLSRVGLQVTTQWRPCPIGGEQAERDN